MNETIKFSEIKEDLLKELNARKDKLQINEPLTLIDGFISQPIYDQITGGIVIGGPTIPMISLIGQNSGRLYLFALKALLPKIGA